MNTPWFLVKDGAQQPGQLSTEEVRQQLTASPGSTFLVWKEGLPGWADPKTLAEFQTQAPLTTQEAPAPKAPAPAAPAQPKSPGDGGAAAMKQGSKLLLEGAAAHLQKVRTSSDSHTYLPHLKLVDLVLNRFSGWVTPGLLDTVDEWAKKIGHFALLGSSVFIFLYGLILGGKSGSFLSIAGMHLLIFPAVIIAQYAAVKFLDAGRVVIGKSPSELNTAAFLETLGLLLLLGAVLSLGGGIYGFIRMVSYSFASAAQMLGMALGACAVLLYMLGLTFHSRLVNVQVGGDSGAGQEAISILSFLMKVSLRLVPFVFGVGNAIGLVLVLIALGRVIGDNWSLHAGAAQKTFANILFLGFYPFFVYLAFLLYYLLLDVLRAILVVPVKLDALAGKKEKVG